MTARRTQTRSSDVNKTNIHKGVAFGKSPDPAGMLTFSTVFLTQTILVADWHSPNLINDQKAQGPRTKRKGHADALAQIGRSLPMVRVSI